MAVSIFGSFISAVDSLDNNVHTFSMTLQTNQNRELTEEIWDVVDQWQQECICAMVTSSFGSSLHSNSSHDSADHSDSGSSGTCERNTDSPQEKAQEQTCSESNSKESENKGEQNTGKTGATRPQHLETKSKMSKQNTLEKETNHHVTSEEENGEAIETDEKSKETNAKSEAEVSKNSGTFRLYRFDQEDILSPEESKWCSSGKKDMMKTYIPTVITKILKSVTTAEEMI